VQGLERGPDFKLWMMAELPTNFLLLDRFLDTGIDGVSIGSNDLTQFVLGVDRDNEQLAEMFDERDPAVLQAIEHVVKTCAARGATVSICGQGPRRCTQSLHESSSSGTSRRSRSPRT